MLPSFRPRRIVVALCLAVAATTALLAAEAPNFETAREHFHARRDAEAEAAFKQLAVEDPKLAEAPFHLGLVAMRRNALAEARDYFETATRLAPTVARYRLRLGDAYGMMAAKAGLFSKLGLAKKCRQSYEQAVALEPNSIEAHWSLMEYFKQAPGIAGGSIERALDQADVIAAINASAGRFARAGVLVHDKEYQKAFALYDGVLDAEPPEYTALNQLAQLVMMTGQQLDVGLAAAQKCLQLPEQPNEPTHAHLQGMLGRLQEMKGDKAAARAAYQAALALDPHFRPAADALKKLGEG